MKSLQTEQNVNCLKNVAMNLCPFTWWTLRLIAPRRRFNIPSLALNTLSPTAWASPGPSEIKSIS